MSMVIHFDNADPGKRPAYKEDFMDYESKISGQPQRFGDLVPINTPLIGDAEYQLLDNIFHKNGIAHKVVTKPAEDATRNGWRIVIPDDPKKQAQYQKALDALNLKQVLCQQIIYQRLHGDGYVTYGIYGPSDSENGQPTSNLYEPLDPKTQPITNVAYVHPFGQDHVQRIETNDDPTDINYLKEQTLVVRQTRSGEKVNQNGTAETNPLKPNLITIDKSRYGHISLDQLETDDHGTSIITTCWDELHTLDTALYSVGKILYAYDINVVHSPQLTQDNGQDTDQAFKKRAKVLQEGMGTDSVLLLNDGEEFERDSANVGGIETLLTFAWQSLAAASNIPKSVLLGEQAGTLAGATTDVANYYDGVKAMQEELLRPELEYIIQLLMWSTDVAGGSEDPDSIDWKLQFNPLWSADDKTNSETNLNNTNAAVQQVNAGIKSPEEASQMLAGQNNNMVQSMETKVDSAPSISLTDAKKLEAGLKKAIHEKENTKD